MPAKSKAQYGKAGAACGRGEEWGCKMVKHTSKAQLKKLPRKVKKKK